MTLYRIGKGSVWVLLKAQVYETYATWQRVGPEEDEHSILDPELDPENLGCTKTWRYFSTDEPS